MARLRNLRNALFGAAIAGALGFGGTQLMASTQAAQCGNIPCSAEQACDTCCAIFFPSPISAGFCGPEGECRCAV